MTRQAEVNSKMRHAIKIARAAAGPGETVEIESEGRVMEEHPVKQKIDAIEILDGEGTIGTFTVGRNCTRIEATQKSGMYANIPYVRVWQGDVALAEFCQHNIHGVYFSKEPSE